ncbi:MAG: undecaprenyl-phosphate glucose phosphotransferase [Bacteroidota bacterium]|nr:undecaprenyl-phosphate glucose phosphotransferase [Bacteroidota bacterium]
MIYTNRHNYIIRISIDIGILLIIAILCFFFDNDIPPSFTISSLFAEKGSILMAGILGWYAGARIFHLYKEVIFFSFSQEIVALMKVLVLYVLVVSCIIFFFFENGYLFRKWVLFDSVILLLVTVIEKYFYRLITAYLRKNKRLQKNIVIIGADSLSSDFYHSAISNNNFRYTVAGILDDEKKDSLNGMYLGKIDALDDVLSQYSIDEVFIGLSGSAYDKAGNIIDICEKRGKRVNILSDQTKLTDSGFKVTNYAGFPVVNIRYFPLDDPENQFLKRLFDIFFSLCFLLFFFSWTFPIIAILIKISSRGPIFFKQERWGLNNQKIICYKFRSMYASSINTDATGCYVQAKKNDARTTPLGRFLRRTSIDEFPQFINVLIGNMSVVGPRPHPIPLNLESKDIVQNYMLRHLVKPGITGWAQVNGSRGETRMAWEMQRRVDLDLWYIENWNIWLDFQIVFQTIINWIKGDDRAY